MAQDDDDAKVKAKAARELIKEALREFKTEEEEKTRTNNPPKKSTGGIFGGLFGD